MDDLVVDVSALVDLLLGNDVGQAVAARLTGMRCTPPLMPTPRYCLPSDVGSAQATWRATALRRS